MTLDDDSLAGKFLIASPSIYDPNFRQAVVLIVHHDEEGAMGVVLNRASETTVGEAAPQLAEIASPDERIYLGGPVQPGSVLVLAEFDEPEAAAVSVLGDIGFVALGSELDDLADATRRVRVFAGHSGWGSGQLEAELEGDDWIIEPASRDDIFDEDVGSLWTTLLRRKGGQFAVMARMPFDPSMN